jgi:hypothetical protein
MRCHSLTAPPRLEDVVLNGAALSASALLLTIVLGALAARAWGHRSRMGLPVPPVVGAIVVSVLLPWWLLWRLVAAPN